MIEKFSYTDKPEEERLFTTIEVAKIAHVEPASVYNICKRECIAYKIKYINCRKTALYDFRTMKRIVEICKKNKGQKVIENKPAETIEQLRKEHPLVTDDKFFKLSYFPDVVPNCFKTE